MHIKGKIIGFLLGLYFFGPLGCMVGLFIGHLYDTGHFVGLGSVYNSHVGRHGELQQLFFDCTFSIMGFIAKADGHVSQREIQFAEQVMLQMQLTGARRERAISQFTQGKSASFDYQMVLSQLRGACRFQPALLRTFLDIQIRVANVNGKMSPVTTEALRRVFLGLGLNESLFRQYYRRSQAGYNYQHYNQSGFSSSPKQHLNDAYDILGVDASISDSELKKAYRRQMSKNHPDRLIAKGVPPEMIKLATQKTQQVKDAYETIKQHREVN